MKARLIVAAVLFCFGVCVAAANAANPAKQRVAATVTSYVMSTFVIQQVRVDYYRVVKVVTTGPDTGTVWFTISVDHGKALRFTSRVACAALPGTKRVCFATTPKPIT